jgi:hypothetical protein
MRATSYLNLALDGNESSASHPSSVTPNKRAGIHCVGGYMGLRLSLEAVEKSKMSCSCQELNPDS